MRDEDPGESAGVSSRKSRPLTQKPQSLSPADYDLILQAPRGWSAVGLGELWTYRELLFFLTWRDVAVRYKQAVLGVLWAILQPFLTMVVFSVIFGKLLKVDTGDEPYAVFSYVALLPWQLFAGSLQRAGTSLVGNANLITKVYFPRLVVPVSAVLAGLVDFVLAFVVLGGLMVYYQITPTWNILWLPALTLLALATALATGLWLSALNVLYRDVQYVIPFLIQVWMYASPIAYPIDLVPESWRFVYGLNPLTGVIQGFRWALLGGPAPDGLVGISAAVVTVLLITGIVYFKRMERQFADVV